jgi:hypothetical protein
MHVNLRPVVASCVLAVSLGVAVAASVVPAAPAGAVSTALEYSPAEDMGGVPHPAPSASPSHDMGSVTGDEQAHDMAGMSHDDGPSMPAPDGVGSDSSAPDSHGTGAGHGDEPSDETSHDTEGPGGSPAAVTTPPEEQRKVVLAGFAAVNLLVLATAGILRRNGHVGRGGPRTARGGAASARRSSTPSTSKGDQA